LSHFHFHNSSEEVLIKRLEQQEAKQKGETLPEETKDGGGKTG